MASAVSVNVKQIFETMEYPPVLWENTTLAEVWLKNTEKVVTSLGTGGTSEGDPFEIYDANYLHCFHFSSSKIYQEYPIENILKKDKLITVYSPKPEDVARVIDETVENEDWFKNVNSTKKAFLIESFAKEIEKNSDLICQLEVLLRGILKNDTKTTALPLLVEYLHYYAGWAIKYSKENLNSKPKKITASVISDNSFLAAFGMVLGPALAAGYNVILQTEQRISAVAALLIQLAENVGIPKGVIRLIPGKIDLNILFQHVDVEVISRFGNLPNKSEDTSNIVLSLDKKFISVIGNSRSSMLVFNDADLDSAGLCAIKACWEYQGMLPWSLRTVFVQEDIFESFVNKLKQRLSTIKVGLAIDQSVDVTFRYLFNSREKSSFQNFEKKIVNAGLEVFRAKNESIYPTLLIGWKSSNLAISDEDDLPYLAVVSFRSANEGINLVNNSKFGLGVSVWTENISLANEVVEKLNVANVWINSLGRFTAVTSFTSYKQSGSGHFGGEEGFLEYVTANPFSMPFSTKQKSSSNLDIDDVVTTAIKGQEDWEKLPHLKRCQLLRQASDEINSKNEILCQMWNVPKTLLENWVATVYEGSVQINNLGSISIHKSYELKSRKEAVGAVIIEDDNLQFLEVIVGAILLGNSVIILNFNTKYSKFFGEISKILLAYGFPKGVFNVILNSSEEVFDKLKTFKDLTTYFTKFHEPLNKLKLEDCKRIYSTGESWSKIITAATRTKNVWSDIGSSSL